MKFTPISFFCFGLFGFSHMSLAMDQRVSTSSLKTAMDKCLHSLHESLNPAFSDDSKIKNSAANACQKIDSLKYALEPELVRRRKSHEGHTVAPLVDAIFAHSHKSLSKIAECLNSATSYDQDLDGITKHGEMCALGCHAEAAAVLERLFGIVNNNQAAFKQSGQTLQSVFSHTSWDKKYTLLMVLVNHHRQWFNCPDNEKIVVPNSNAASSSNTLSDKVMVPCTRTNEHVNTSDVPKKRKDKEKDEEDVCSSCQLTTPSSQPTVPVTCTTTTSVADSEQVRSSELGVQQLKKAANVRAYLHDAYMHLLIALGDVNLLLDDLAFRLPFDEDGITKLAPDDKIGAVSAHGNHLANICHDGYMTKLPVKICSKLFQASTLAHKIGNLADKGSSYLTPASAISVQEKLNRVRQLRSVSSTAAKVTNGASGWMWALINFVTPSNKDTYEEVYNELEEERLKLIEKEKIEEEKKVENTRKEQQESIAREWQAWLKRNKIERQAQSCSSSLNNAKEEDADQEKEAMIKLFDDLRKMASDCSSFSNISASIITRIRHYVQDCADLYTRAKSYGSPEFRDLMENTAAEWATQQGNLEQNQQSGNKDTRATTTKNT